MAVYRCNTYMSDKLNKLCVCVCVYIYIYMCVYTYVTRIYAELANKHIYL